MFKFGKKKDAKAATETPAEEPVAVAEDEDGEAAPAKKKLPLKMMIIAGAAAVLVLGGGGGAAFFLLSPKDHAGKAGEHGKKKPKKAKGGHGAKDGPVDKTQPQISEGPDGVVFYTLPDLVVNMQTADGKPTFLKLKLTLELPDHEVAEALEPNRPRLQDMFTTFLRELRPEDLSGSQGTYQLRLEILRRINLVIAPAKVNAVLIEEMLIN
ncbi:MAG TPA: flagellar basal body-associated FliL family protein [Caulobacteraceae bacterium]|jgi:flagellar FliL protein